MQIICLNFELGLAVVQWIGQVSLWSVPACKRGRENCPNWLARRSDQEMCDLEDSRMGGGDRNWTFIVHWTSEIARLWIRSLSFFVAAGLVSAIEPEQRQIADAHRQPVFIFVSINATPRKKELPMQSMSREPS